MNSYSKIGFFLQNLPYSRIYQRPKSSMYYVQGNYMQEKFFNDYEKEKKRCNDDMREIINFWLCM